MIKKNQQKHIFILLQNTSAKKYQHIYYLKFIVKMTFNIYKAVDNAEIKAKPTVIN